MRSISITHRYPPKAIILMVFTHCLLFVAGYAVSSLSDRADAATGVCPVGSYFIDTGKDGQPLCRLEPTGCPYGDSVPLGAECDKLANQNPGGKDYGEGSIDPDRNFFDADGNEYDYKGNLIKPMSQNTESDKNQCD